MRDMCETCLDMSAGYVDLNINNAEQQPAAAAGRGSSRVGFFVGYSSRRSFHQIENYMEKGCVSAT